MQQNEKINVAGKMKTLAIGESFLLEKSNYKVLSVRVVASAIKIDFGLVFRVSLIEDKIKIERTN